MTAIKAYYRQHCELCLAIQKHVVGNIVSCLQCITEFQCSCSVQLTDDAISRCLRLHQADAHTLS